MANLQRLEAIAHSMLKPGEKIEAKVRGSYSDDSRPGKNEIVKGFMAATNYRLLVVLNSISPGIRKDSIAYEQITAVTRHDHLINVVMPDETITLFEVDGGYADPKKFYSYVAEKKMARPKPENTTQSIVIPPLKKPPKTLIKKIEAAEVKNKGMVVAIDPDSENYFLGKDTIDAVAKGKKKLPKAIFYCIRIGYPGVYRLHGRFQAL